MTRAAAKLGECTERELAKGVKFEANPNSQFAGKRAHFNSKSSLAKTGKRTHLAVLRQETNGSWRVAD